MRTTARRLLTGLLATATVAAGLGATVPATATAAAPAAPVVFSPATIAPTPYLGWSSWSLQATTYPGVNPHSWSSWLNEDHILQQANALVSTGLASAGYTFVNIDAAWYADIDRNPHFDAYGRIDQDTTRFPDPMATVVDKVHALGLKMGVYDYAGMAKEAYNLNAPVYGTTHGCTTQNAVLRDSTGAPVVLPSAWDNAYALDMSDANPCGYEYIHSVAQKLAGYGIDYLKLDGVTPSGTSGTVADLARSSYYEVAGWRKAFDALGWQGHLELSWAMRKDEAPYWQQNATGVRTQGDVECYCSTLVDWNHVVSRFTSAPGWAPYTKPGFFPDLDSLDVGNGAMDGLTDDQRRTATTLWSIVNSPMYTGDDLTKLDSLGLSLLTNPEVIAQNQQGLPAKPVSQATNQQTWYVRNKDGSYTVALFNLGSTAATVTANWADLGLRTAQSAGVHDMWTHTDLGAGTGSFSATLPAYGSRLLKLTPSGPVAPSGPITGLAGKCADVKGAVSTDGTDLDLWGCNGGANQNWTIPGDGTVRAYGKCMDVRGGATAAGTSVQLYTCNGTPAQSWTYQSDHTLKNTKSGMCLDVAGATSTSGTRLDIWPCSAAGNQLWNLPTA
ncbi:ricin-type beta-trefoil lectin domain protein [Kitasatospora sp. NPDC090308]|uniref:ricin-type beta-trefoil lectin domain protein n=1 Tax=Kitasatospora sp. NPDC090308 TaxID=3364082 RepID=UPI003803F43B